MEQRTNRGARETTKIAFDPFRKPRLLAHPIESGSP